MRKIVVTAALALCAVMPSVGLASDAQVREFVRLAVEAANTMFSKGLPNDGVTVSAQAYAQDKAIVYEYVLAIRKDVTEGELDGWRRELYKEIVPGSCAVLSQGPFFDEGLHYRYIYLRRSGEVLEDLKVDRKVCRKY